LDINQEIKEIRVQPGSANNYYAIALLAPKDDKNNLEKVLKSNNIISDPMRYKYCPLYKLPIVKTATSGCENAEDLINRILTLPTHEGLEMKSLAAMIEVIHSYYD
jgi:dTDP-4-amino-4,6-dideoxygalactose transaminase